MAMAMVPQARDVPGDAPSTLLHIRCEPGTDETRYRLLLALLEEITPLVQALPPSAALADVRSALRYWSMTAFELARRIRGTALARYDLDTRIGIAPAWSLAAMASARPGADGITQVGSSPAAIAAFLAPLPVEALHGMGPAQAETLRRSGLRTVGALAAAPLVTVERLLGGGAGRLFNERAHGIDPRPVTPADPAHTVVERRDLGRGTLDAAVIRTALLHTVEAVAVRLRRRRQVAATLTLVVAFADHTTLSRSRALPRGSASVEELRLTAYRMFDSLGPQRVRVRALTVKAEGLAPSETARDAPRPDCPGRRPASAPASPPPPKPGPAPAPAPAPARARDAVATADRDTRNHGGPVPARRRDRPGDRRQRLIRSCHGPRPGEGRCSGAGHRQEP
ncbi:hypothetical protein NGB36_29020 [Streptomyces sp. RB6PN25]|uniref:UmuC domain-containing protein n=1 Tax=Streptomyces humicola TaxID=2953240 RepID=A0ABT1Q3L2_9ACTN|nr:hypothetical protein [Streptomyces humicola]MCQ4084506.1 hypothetical protein [Streptomyces humicola]